MVYHDAIPDDALVTVAIVLSRVEALVMASMLRAAGILVHIDGDQHASVEVISLGLGGHRLLVPAWQWEEASGVIREAGVPGSWEFCAGPRKAFVRFFLAYSAAWLAFTLPVIAIDSGAARMLLGLPFSILGINMNPQGPPEFFLAPEEA